MEKFEFKYYDRSLAIKCIALGVFIGLASQILSEEIVSIVISGSIFMAGGIIFVCLSGYGLLGSNFKGIGILHEDCVEIKLRGKDYRIEYVNISHINVKNYTFTGYFRRWHIHIHDKPTIILRQGSGFFRKKTNLYPLERFMTALCERLKPESIGGHKR